MRLTRLLVLALFALPVLATPASAQEDPSLIELLLDLGAIREAPADPGEAQRVDGTDEVVLMPIEATGQGGALIPLDLLDRNGDGFDSATDLFGNRVTPAPRGEPIMIGSPDRPDLPYGYVILPETDAFWDFSQSFRWNVVRLNQPLDGPEGVTEVGFYEVRSGLPLIEPIEGLNLPGSGFTTGTGFVSTEDGQYETGQIQTVDTGLPFSYASPYVGATWTANGAYFVAVGTENPQSDLTFIISNGTDPDDPSSFVWQPYPFADDLVELTQEDIDAATASLVERSALPAPEITETDGNSGAEDAVSDAAGDGGGDDTTTDAVDPPTEDPPADGVPPEEDASVDDTPEEEPVEAAGSSEQAVESDDAPAAGGEDDGGGLPMGIVAVPIVIAGVVVGTLFYVRRRNPDTGRIDVETLEPVKVGRSSQVAARLAEQHLAAGGEVGPSGMFVPGYEALADVLHDFPDGDHYDIFVLRMLNEHINGKPLGGTLPEQLRSRIGAAIGPSPKHPGSLQIGGMFPESVHLAGGLAARNTLEYGTHDFPSDSVIAVHAASGKAYWVPRDALPSPAPGPAPALEGDALLGSTTDEVIVL